MSLLDNLKAIINNDNDGDEDYGDEPNYSNDNRSYDPPAPQPQNNGSRMADEERNRLNISLTAQLRVILVKPEKFTDTKEIANHLNNKQTVVLNLESTTPDVTRRIIDFLGGVAYANGGSIKPVANNTFIITPYTVSFQGDELSEQLESNGVLL
ncbi:MAG: cell division protein SepF [Oscillospiraceae bacterium]|nr:cell division protein SepF [Oscillospiraceae bacterium]